MPFHMTADRREDCIDREEEVILELTYGDGHYPELSQLWEEFYDGPRLSPDRCGRLANELEHARSLNVLPPSLVASATRLIEFFRFAYEDHCWVECNSD